MGELLANVLPLAVGAAISPTLFGAQLLTLSSREAPLQRSWALAAGAGAVLAGYSVLGLAVGLGTSDASQPSKVDAAIKLAVALLLAWLGIRAALRGPKPAKQRGAGHEPRLSRAFALGAILMLTNVTTLALYFPAMHDIGIADVDDAEKLAAIVLAYAITMALVVLPPLTVSVLGDRGRAGISRLGAFMSRHAQAIAVAVPLLFAVVLAAQAIPDLL